MQFKGLDAQGTGQVVSVIYEMAGRTVNISTQDHIAGSNQIQQLINGGATLDEIPDEIHRTSIPRIAILRAIGFSEDEIDDLVAAYQLLQQGSNVNVTAGNVVAVVTGLIEVNLAYKLIFEKLLF